LRTRRAARRLALDVLYAAEIRDELPADALRARKSGDWVVPAAEDATDPPEGLVEEDSPGSPSEALEYARALVEGVQAHQADIDELIARYADRWAITRMPVIDRTVVRIALFELLWRDDVPVPVAINEAVELVKALSTEDSGRFVNGLLGRIAESAPGPGSERLDPR
jgi:transcription antitermination protein NusB